MGTFTAPMASGYEARIITSVNVQSTETNQTYEHIEVKIVKTNPNVRASANTGNSWSLRLNGVEINSGSFTYDFPLGATAEKLLLATDRWIGHDADGTKSVTWSATISTLNVGSASPGGTEALPTIARASVPTLSASHTDAGQSVTINTNRASTSFTHTVRYALGSASGTIATGVGASTAWTIPLSILNEIPDSNTGYGSIYLDTYSGGSLIGTKSVAFAVRVPTAGKPTIGGATVVDTVTNPAGALVQRVSKPKVTITGIATYYGSPIMSARIIMAGETINLSAGQLEGTLSAPITVAGVGASGVPVVLEVTDSRGRVGTLTPKVDVLPYSPVQIKNVVPSRREEDGVTESDSGIYVRLDFQTIIASLVVGGTEKNAASYTLQYRAVGGTTWTADKSGPVPIGTTTAFQVSSATLVVDASREYRLVVTDAFGFAEALPVMAASVVLHLDGSAGIGVRKVRQRGAIDTVGDAYFTGQVYNGGSTTQRLIGFNDHATQAEAEARTITNKWMSPLRVAQALAAALLVHAGIFRAVHADTYVETPTSLAVGATRTVTINFPAGKFSAPPVVLLTSYSGRMNVVLQSKTATSMVVQYQNNSTGAGSTANIDYLAVQMQA